MGDKISEYRGWQYKSLADEIANDIKNFQGKTIRTHDQAMKSLNKIMSNPAMKIRQADTEALVNAWRSVNANDMANKISNLGRAFRVADLVLKVEKIREKSIVGYETNNWEPLMLEVESWILSGTAASITIALFTTSIGSLTLPGLVSTSLTIFFIVVISYIASLINAGVAEKLNNELLRLID